MNKSPLRKETIDTLVEALKLLDHTRAMAQFDAAASSRLDEYSDADLAAVADDDRTDEVFSVTEQVLSLQQLAFQQGCPSSFSVVEQLWLPALLA